MTEVVTYGDVFGWLLLSASGACGLGVLLCLTLARLDARAARRAKAAA